MKTLNVSFNEEQHINQWWLRLILIATLAVIGYAAYSFLQQENSSMNHLTFWPGIVIGIGVLPIIWFWKLTTKIDNYGISVKCPFVNKKVNWDEIEKLEVLDYGFVGGWGIRIGTRYGTVYNASGRKGMAIVLKNKKKFLIGTQKESELKRIVEKWNNRSEEI